MTRPFSFWLPHHPVAHFQSAHISLFLSSSLPCRCTSYHTRSFVHKGFPVRQLVGLKPSWLFARSQTMSWFCIKICPKMFGLVPGWNDSMATQTRPFPSSNKYCRPTTNTPIGAFKLTLRCEIDDIKAKSGPLFDIILSHNHVCFAKLPTLCPLSGVPLNIDHGILKIPCLSWTKCHIFCCW